MYIFQFTQGSVYLFTYIPFIHRSSNLSIHRSIYPSIYPLTHQIIYLFSYPFIHTLIHLSCLKFAPTSSFTILVIHPSFQNAPVSSFLGIASSIITPFDPGKITADLRIELKGLSNSTFYKSGAAIHEVNLCVKLVLQKPLPKNKRRSLITQKYNAAKMTK